MNMYVDIKSRVFILHANHYYIKIMQKVMKGRFHAI